MSEHTHRDDQRLRHQLPMSKQNHPSIFVVINTFNSVCNMLLLKMLTNVLLLLVFGEVGRNCGRHAWYDSLFIYLCIPATSLLLFSALSTIRTTSSSSSTSTPLTHCNNHSISKTLWTDFICFKYSLQTVTVHSDSNKSEICDSLIHKTEKVSLSGHKYQFILSWMLTDFQVLILYD